MRLLHRYCTLSSPADANQSPSGSQRGSQIQSAGDPASNLVPEAFDAAVLARLHEYQMPGEEDMVTGVLERFLATTTTQMIALGSALAGGDLAAAREIAHSLKSSAGFSGALRFAAACNRLEEAARTGDAVMASAAHQHLRHEYETVLPLLSAALDQARIDRDAAKSG